MNSVKVWMLDLRASIGYGLSYVMFRVFFLPEMVMKIAYCTPAQLRALASGQPEGDFYRLCWMRYTYACYYRLAGVARTSAADPDEMLAVQESLRELIDQIDEIFELIY